jgi:hypothetical protein
MTVTDGRTEAQTGGPTRPRPDPGRLFVDGGWRESAGGGRADLLDPSAGQVVTTVADGNAAAADAAVAAARRAFDEGPWSQTPGRERARVLLRVADGIRRRGDELAAVESIDVGKPITLSRAVDVNTVVEQDEYYAALAQTLDGAARAIPLPPTRYSDPMLPDDVAADFPGPTIVPATPRCRGRTRPPTRRTSPSTCPGGRRSTPAAAGPGREHHAAHKVLFGSDFPVITPDRWRADVAALDIKPEVRRLILEDNAVRMPNLGGWHGGGRVAPGPRRLKLRSAGSCRRA